MGRKTKFTTQTVKKILAAIRSGKPDRLACMEAGISHETYYLWWQQKPDFKRLCHEARAAAAQPLIQKIQQHFDKDWRAAAYLLEKALPDIYGKGAEVIIENNTTVNVEVGAQIEGGRALEVVKKQLEHDAIITRN